mgnify:CR=1 FL=1
MNMHIHILHFLNYCTNNHDFHELDFIAHILLQTTYSVSTWLAAHTGWRSKRLLQSIREIQRSEKLNKYIIIILFNTWIWWQYFLLWLWYDKWLSVVIILHIFRVNIIWTFFLWKFNLLSSCMFAILSQIDKHVRNQCFDRNIIIMLWFLSLICFVVSASRKKNHIESE